MLRNFHFSSSFPIGALDIINPRSPNLLPESYKSTLPSQLEWERMGKTKVKAKPQSPSCPKRYLFRLQPWWDPGILLQGAARVIVRGGVPLEVKHEFADGLLHVQGHHCHHVLFLRALAVQTDLPAKSKGGRWEGKQNKPFFHLVCQSPALGSQTTNAFLGNWLLAKASKGAYHSIPVFAEVWHCTRGNAVKGQRSPGRHAKYVSPWTPTFSSKSVSQEECQKILFY